MNKKSTFDYIPGFSSYLVSEDGLVFSLPKWGTKGKLLSPRQNHQGYWQVAVVNDKGESKFMYVHRLVAMAWIPKKHNQKDCNIVMHLDDNPSNNHVSNLKWGTQFQNMQGVNNNPPKGKVRYGIRENCIRVMEHFRLNKDFDGKKTDLIKLIAKDLNLSSSYVNLIAYHFILDFPDLVERYSDLIKRKK